MNKKNQSVDGFIRKNKRWAAELNTLREIMLETPLVEDMKWRTPCYTLDGKNVLFIGAWKEVCVVSFLKGVLMKDPKKVLEMPGENTRSARFIRFADATEINKLTPTLKAYVKEAIAIEKSGAKFDFKNDAEMEIPEELQVQFDEVPELKTAFNGLTPGRRRAYVLHFGSAKQSKTRAARVEKWMQHILSGKGIDDE